MKKTFLCFVLSLAVIVSLFAAETNPYSVRDESKWSDMTYVNIPILKILEAKDGYVVIYEKNKIGTGTTVIPKSWAKGSPENPRKLRIRNIHNPAESFMTIVKKNGEFHRVILNMPKSKSSSLWGVLEYSSTKLEGSDKETLEELDL